MEGPLDGGVPLVSRRSPSRSDVRFESLIEPEVMCSWVGPMHLLSVAFLFSCAPCASGAARFPRCDWPEPLYRPPGTLSESASHVMKTIAKLQAFMEHEMDVVLYLVDGGLLGLYRDGRLIPGDNDVDIYFAVRGRNPVIDRQLRDIVVGDEPHERDIAVIDMYEWGDTWNPHHLILPAASSRIAHGVRRGSGTWLNISDMELFLGQEVSYEIMNDAVFGKVLQRLCLPPVAGICTQGHSARAELEFHFGPHWFIKMPWKGQELDQWYAWAQPSHTWHSYWIDTIGVIRGMDLDENEVITSDEIDEHVTRAHIDTTEYAAQISARDKCRAASMLTFMLAYAEAPHPLVDEGQRLVGRYDQSRFFPFPQCEPDAKFRVYVDMTADLFHYGHANFLRKCRLFGQEQASQRGLSGVHVIVGVHSDEDVAAYKRTPILSMRERVESVQQCKYADEVVGNAPLLIPKTYLLRLGVDAVLHGDDFSQATVDSMYGAAVRMGIFHTVAYTHGISTSELIQRCQRGNATKIMKTSSVHPTENATRPDGTGMRHQQVLEVQDPMRMERQSKRSSEFSNFHRRLRGPWPGDEHYQAGRKLTRAIGSLVGKGKSLLDLGAGSGQFGYCFNHSGCAKDMGVDWRGYDGAVNVEEYTSNARVAEVPELPVVKFANLSEPALLPTSDWVLSLEVGEHLRPGETVQFIVNLHLANRDGVIISWALASPWQHGHYHLNNHDNSEVICVFERLGYEFDGASSDVGREAALHDGVTDWLSKTYMVFRRAFMAQPLAMIVEGSLGRSRRRADSDKMHTLVSEAVAACFKWSKKHEIARRWEPGTREVEDLYLEEKVLLILVLSARQHFQRRNAIRQSWATGFSHLYFIVSAEACHIPPKYRANAISCEADGARQIPEDEFAEYNRTIMLESELLLREGQDHNDMVIVKGVDVYQNLPHKLKHAYHWASQKTIADWILKVDDDCVVRVSQLVAFMKTQDLDPQSEPAVFGRIARNYNVLREGKWADLDYSFPSYPPFPLGSAGYVVSRMIVNVVSSLDLPAYQGEDVSLGIWLDKTFGQDKMIWASSSIFSDQGNCWDASAFVIGHTFSSKDILACQVLHHPADNLVAIKNYELIPFAETEATGGGAVQIRISIAGVQPRARYLCQLEVIRLCWEKVEDDEHDYVVHQKYWLLPPDGQTEMDQGTVDFVLTCTTHRLETQNRGNFTYRIRMQIMDGGEGVGEKDQGVLAVRTWESNTLADLRCLG